jgi:hypothetical protein
MLDTLLYVGKIVLIWTFVSILLMHLYVSIIDYKQRRIVNLSFFGLGVLFFYIGPTKIGDMNRKLCLYYYEHGYTMRFTKRWAVGISTPLPLWKESRREHLN